MVYKGESYERVWESDVRVEWPSDANHFGIHSLRF